MTKPTKACKDYYAFEALAWPTDALRKENEGQMKESKEKLQPVLLPNAKASSQNYWDKKGMEKYKGWIRKKLAEFAGREKTFSCFGDIKEDTVQKLQSRGENRDLMFKAFLQDKEAKKQWDVMVVEVRNIQKRCDFDTLEIFGDGDGAGVATTEGPGTSFSGGTGRSSYLESLGPTAYTSPGDAAAQGEAAARVLDAAAQVEAATGADSVPGFLEDVFSEQGTDSTSTQESSLSKEVDRSQNQSLLHLLYLEITAQNLCEAGISMGQLQREQTRVRQFMHDKVEKLGMDPQQIKHEISSECQWSYRFEGIWDCRKAESLQEELIASYRVRFGVSELAGNFLRVEKKCYRVVVRGSLELFEAFQQQEKQFHEDMAGKLPEGIERAEGARAQLNRVFVTVRCSEKVRNRLMAATEGPPANKQKREAKAAEEEGSVEVTVQPMDGASFGVMLGEGGGSNSSVRALKAKIEKVDGAACERQELFMLVEGEEAKSEGPLSDDFEFKSACTVALCVRPVLTRLQQNLRYLGNIKAYGALRLHLLEKGYNTKTGALAATKRWLESPEGQANLVPNLRTGGTDQDWTLHHILPPKGGKLDWPDNYFLMPRSANSHFGGDFTSEKARYIGKTAEMGALNLNKWISTFAGGRSIDYAFFNPNILFRPSLLFG